MDIKYLADGRKVVVIGQLNNVESIVQEVFVTESGDEIPSGEKFTTKNLLDQPAVSWKAKEEAKQEARLTSIKGEVDRTNRELNSMREKLDGLRKIFAQSKRLSETLEEQDLDTLAMFMSGSIKYLVRVNYGTPELLKFEDVITEKSEYGHYKDLKLMSLFGNSDGKLSYRISSYSDGSGSYANVYPFDNLEDAKSLINSLVLKRMEKGYFPSVGDINKLHKIGVKFDRKTAKKIKEHITSSHAKLIKNRDEETAKMQKRHEQEVRNLEAALPAVG